MSKKSVKTPARLIIKDPLSVYAYEDNLEFIAEEMSRRNRNRSEVIRELIDDGIRYRKIKTNGFDEVGEFFKNYLTTATNNALRPLRKQLDDFVQEVTESEKELAVRVEELINSTNQINERTRSIGNTVERLNDKLVMAEQSRESLVSAEVQKQLDAVQSLAELSVRNLIGIRVVVWLYLIEMLTPLVKSYMNIGKKEFNEMIKEHVMKLFTDDALKELAFMKADEIENYIQVEVVNLYQQLREATRPV